MKMTVSVLCSVCKTVEKKYKCPVCMIFYCSLDCFKIHKTTTCNSFSQSSDEEDPGVVVDTLGEDASMLFPTKNTNTKANHTRAHTQQNKTKSTHHTQTQRKHKTTP